MPIDLADYHRIALLIGIDTIADVIRWADDEISRRDMPASALIDLSLGKSKSVGEIEMLLRSLVTDLSDSSARKMVLKQMSSRIRDGDWPIEDAIDRIYNYAKIDRSAGELRLEMIGIAEDLYCIRDGGFAHDDVSVFGDPLLETLAAYCGPTVDSDDHAT